MFKVSDSDQGSGGNMLLGAMVVGVTTEPHGFESYKA